MRGKTYKWDMSVIMMNSFLNRKKYNVGRTVKKYGWLASFVYQIFKIFYAEKFHFQVSILANPR